MSQTIRSGIILRSYAKTPEVVDEVVARAVKSAQKVCTLKANGVTAFDNVMFVVPQDFDCGLTAARLKQAFGKKGLLVQVLTAPGHHSCAALNVATIALDILRVQYAFILSNKALDYLDTPTVEKMLEVLSSGKKVVGVEIPSLSDIAENPIQNTFAAWDAKALRRTGGFDCETGVEEVAPIIRLMREFGTDCAAIIKGRADAQLDVRSSADGQARHKDVKETKRPRQAEEAERLGVDLEWVKNNIVSVAA